MKKKVIVIGAGAAGLMAACAASDLGADVTIYEKNEKAGKKIYITGKGRCNFTNTCETAEFFDHVISNPKFLYSAVYGFDQTAVIRFMEENGCRTKVERGKRAFPVSDHASDITKALTDHLKKNHVKILYHETVKEILTTNEQDKKGKEEEVREEEKSKKHPGDGRSAWGVLLSDGRKVPADAVILATGGLSYPSTGSTGDGYRFAQKLGLAVIPEAPSLVPLLCKELWPAALQGLSLKNVSVTVVPREEVSEEKEPSGSTGKEGDHKAGEEGRAEGRAERKAQEERNDHTIEEKKEGVCLQAGVPLSDKIKRTEKTKAAKKKRQRPVYEGFGELMFTHEGLTGPLILSASAHCDFLKNPQGYLLYLDLKPALSEEQLIERIEREFSLAPDRAFAHALRPLFPERLSLVMAERFAVVSKEMTDKDREEFLKRKVRTFSEKEIRKLAELIKKLPVTITGTGGFEQAVITRGGISVKEFDPSTMESKKIRGLYAAGEVLDVDALTGGFNLQIAWSTGHLAGVCAAEGRKTP